MIAVHDAVGGGPVHGLPAPAVLRHVAEGAGAGHGLLTVHPEEDGDQHAAGEVAVRGKQRVGHAVDIALARKIRDLVVEPVARLHIVEALLGLGGLRGLAGIDDAGQAHLCRDRRAGDGLAVLIERAAVRREGERPGGAGDLEAALQHGIAGSAGLIVDKGGLDLPRRELCPGGQPLGPGRAVELCRVGVGGGDGQQLELLCVVMEAEHAVGHRGGEPHPDRQLRAGRGHVLRLDGQGAALRSIGADGQAQGQDHAQHHHAHQFFHHGSPFLCLTPRWARR